MNKEQLLKEQFNEEMFERRANGIDTEPLLIGKDKRWLCVNSSITGLPLNLILNLLLKRGAHN